MSVELIAVKPLKYRTRMMVPGQNFRVKNEREARVLVHLKRAERVDNADRYVALDDARAKVGLPALSKVTEDINALRVEYLGKIGRRPFNGWDAETLKEKIASA